VFPRDDHVRFPVCSGYSNHSENGEGFFSIFRVEYNRKRNSLYASTPSRLWGSKTSQVTLEKRAGRVVLVGQKKREATSMERPQILLHQEHLYSIHATSGFTASRLFHPRYYRDPRRVIKMMVEKHYGAFLQPDHRRNT